MKNLHSLKITLLALALCMPVEGKVSTAFPPEIFVFGWQPGNGNNFTYGGARTYGHRTGLNLLRVLGQVNSFTVGLAASGDMIDPDTLSVLFAGANNAQVVVPVNCSAAGGLPGWVKRRDTR